MKSKDATKDDYSQLFAYVDFFIENKVAKVQEVVDRLSPGTITCLDETGTLSPMIGGLQDPTFWVASGAYWAYMWARVAVEQGSNVAVVGQSQYMDSPDREAGVTMMDWTSGNGTAKYWVNRLIIESVSLGDQFRSTVTASKTGPAAPLFAQAYTHGGTSNRVLLINKQNAPTTITIAGGTTARVVDSMSNQGPPRTVAMVAGVILLDAFATAIVTVSP